MMSEAYHSVLQMARELSADEQLQLIEDLISVARHKVQEIPLHDIMEFQGVAKESWKGVDVEKYIDEERNSWE